VSNELVVTYFKALLQCFPEETKQIY